MKNKNMYYALFVCGFFTTIMGIFFLFRYKNDQDGVVDYQDVRDKVAVKNMFHDDWKYLYYGDWDKITEDSYNVDFMLDHRSSSQLSVNSNLILKVLREHGQTIGFLAYHPKSPYVWQMLFVVVDKNHRGKGCAGKLVQYCIDDTKARGALKLMTFTRLINTPARSVYEGKFGFKDVEHHDDKYMDLALYLHKS